MKGKQGKQGAPGKRGGDGGNGGPGPGPTVEEIATTARSIVMASGAELAVIVVVANGKYHACWHGEPMTALGLLDLGRAAIQSVLPMGPVATFGPTPPAPPSPKSKAIPLPAGLPKRRT